MTTESVHPEVSAEPRGARTKHRRTRYLLMTAPLFDLSFGSATESTLFIGCLLMLGATEFEAGLVGSLSLIGQLGILVAPFLIRATQGRRRQPLMLLTLLRYVIWIPVALFPLFSPPHAVWWCLVLVAISGFFAAMCNPIYLAWIASVVPREERDRYEASRAGLFVIPAMIMGPVAGHILDAMGERSGFPMVFGIGIGVGLLAMVWYALSEESRAETHGIPSVFGQVRASLSRPRYRALILFSTLLASGTGMILFSVGLILLKFLSASYVFITAWNAASKPGKMLSCFGVGWVSQRFGAIATLRISLLCLGSAPMVLLLAQPDTLYWVPVYLILYGLLDGCVAVPRSVLIMNWVDPKEQTADLAVMYALLTIATSIGTFLGALILHRFAGQQWHFLNRTYVPSHLVLLIGGALVLMSGLSLFRHHGEEPSPS